jgi:methionyl-tRNA formyltransferase
VSIALQHRLRVIFVGHAATVAMALAEHGLEVVACVVSGTTGARGLLRDVRNALRPAGRPVIERVAQRIRAPLVRIHASGDWSRLDGMSADLLICAGFPRRIPESVFARFPLGSWNIHPSLLPAHRGPRPVERALLAGDDRTGVTVHRITGELDAGAILWSAESPIFPGERCDVLTRRLLAMVAHDLDDIIVAIRSEPGRAIAQPLSVLEPRPTPDELRPDLRADARVVQRRLQAANGGRFRDGSGDIHIAITGRAVEEAPAAPVGHVLRHSGRHVLVRAGRGAVWLSFAVAPRSPPIRLEAIGP